MMGMALTGKVSPYKIGFGPFPSDVYHLPFPSMLHGVSVADTLQALTQLFKADIEPSRVAAIIIEPEQGEGGFYAAPIELMRALRKLCNEHGILLIADEVQTGFARTGKLFAMEHYDVEADLITMAKGLAGGMPLSAVCGRAEIMDAPSPGGLGGTYAGNPIAVAAAHAVLDIIEEEKLCERANILGMAVKTRLNSLRERVPQIAEVRGLGAMVGLEFIRDGIADVAFTQQVQAKALENGLLLLICGSYGNVIRFLFPLTISDALLNEGLDILEQAMLSAVMKFQA
jgi:4-aminobutyrate aminotransferase